MTLACRIMTAWLIVIWYRRRLAVDNVVGLKGSSSARICNGVRSVDYLASCSIVLDDFVDDVVGCSQ